MILITGAGGKTGRALLQALSKVESLSALVHRQEYVSIVKSLGAGQVLVGDMRDDSAVHLAMQGVRAVYHVCPNMSPDEIAIGAVVIREALKAGVTHFVYHSVLHPQTEKMKHHWQKLRVEEMIFESGLPFTILQPAPYMQNLLAGWKGIMEGGVLHVPYSVRSKFSFVDLEDVAEAAKIVLTEPNHVNAIYELAGTLPISHVEVAEIFTRVLNRPVRAERSEPSLRAQSTPVPGARHPGVPGNTGERDDYKTNHLTRMFAYYDQWGLVGNPNILRWLLRRKPTSLESFIERIMRKTASP
jgi:uncharacterized protein YbjT (DUF2867 family)